VGRAGRRVGARAVVLTPVFVFGRRVDVLGDGLAGQPAGDGADGRADGRPDRARHAAGRRARRDSGTDARRAAGGRADARAQRVRAGRLGDRVGVGGRVVRSPRITTIALHTSSAGKK